MKKLSLVIAAFTLALSLAFAGAAMAQTQIPTYPDPDPGCQSDCEPTEVGVPFDPFCMIDCDEPEVGQNPDPCLIDCGPGDGGGNNSTRSADLCGDKLGHLRRVTVSQIESVGTDDLIDIVPVCRSKSLASEQEDVAQLRPVIGENAVLDQELDQDGYNPEDVVGIIVDGSQVVLYVHRL